ncbi:EamA family transporter RarD [Microbacterium sp. SORGH_AS_0888]|uniref:EamA family transporter RarD n=1 Tax=Microbacterium sp. SORGH_AS_0888 TaxID=3041791 RepID=UPI002780E36B|nr:EamA family transporter RarD [Microbacterium sp. SORGH_AS_0888]MDQ1131145.1 chloramphenicol-sensitive protein RarD [Microbacterium sp. SORGH_AS_0888]
MVKVGSSHQHAVGGLLSFLAYLLWGFFPLYFLLLSPTGPWEVVGWRIVFSLVFCAVLLAIVRGYPRVRAVLRTPRLAGLTALAGALIYVNWQVYLVATLTGHLIEASLGYFINPLVTVLLGVIVLRERLRILQWLTIGLAAVAVVVLIVGYGTVPWISFALAFSFGMYGLVKKQIGPRVDALSGLALESMWLTPVAVVQLAVVAATSGLTLTTAGPAHASLVAAAGIVTAVPLLLFAEGARRAPLSLIGLLQFATPILQFITGAWILGEPMPLERWIGFGIIWLALVMLSVDSIVSAWRRPVRSDAVDTAPEAGER